MNETNIVSCGIDIDFKGAAIVISKGLEIKKCIFINGKNSSYGPDSIRIDYLCKKVISFLEKFRIDFVGIESESLGSRRSNYLSRKSRLLGVMTNYLLNSGYMVLEIPPKSAKAFVGNGNANKEKTNLLTKEKFKKGFYKKKKTGKVLHEDLMDALMLSQFTYSYFYFLKHENVPKYNDRKAYITIRRSVKEKRLQAYQGTERRENQL